MLSLQRVARVAEQVDAQDLKSCCQQWQYGFDSRPGHFKRLKACIESLCFRGFLLFYKAFLFRLLIRLHYLFALYVNFSGG